METPYHAKIQEIRDPVLSQRQLRLLVIREDLAHPFISGNKYRKLRYNLREAARLGHDTLLTFGGAYSNHIYATAAAAYERGFQSLGIIRGEEHLPLNPTLRFAAGKGMVLHYMNRERYRHKNSPEIAEELGARFGRFYLIPEGGTNVLAVKGCAEIIPAIDMSFDVICTAVGTGGTMAGLVAGLAGQKKVIGFSALKGGDFLREEVTELVKAYSGKAYGNWEIQTGYHFGGYARIRPELVGFMQNFRQQYGIPLDPVYTGKMFYGIYELARQHYFKKNTTIMALHTGGLQGVAGFEEKYGRRF